MRCYTRTSPRLVSSRPPLLLVLEIASSAHGLWAGYLTPLPPSGLVASVSTSPGSRPPPASRLPPRSWPLPAPLALSSSLLSAQHSAALDLPASSASSDYRLWRSPLCLLRLARPSPPPTTKCYRGTYLRRCSCTLIDFWH